jgi:hypothetical protein
LRDAHPCCAPNMHTCCELELAPRSRRTYASPTHRAQLRLGSKTRKLSVYSLNWVTPLRVGACAQLFNTTNSLALTTCFLLTEQPRQPVFESGLNRSSRA